MTPTWPNSMCGVSHTDDATNRFCGGRSPPPPAAFASVRRPRKATPARIAMSALAK
eukprot:CAMPEP_0170312432 /NCGR_PEP_ID=MMETSP0116_2-20130129/56751_1 /TAXON_ID=400756 /ORGANISM="Durinskia baltica, Strain CSIRO CS-38" /LENGTH=55 /DNA_ID=CAMNT_0010564805 /DNA_START=177 /DNA_END=344 /DNA_ORIENTATION=-